MVVAWPRHRKNLGTEEQHFDRRSRAPPINRFSKAGTIHSGADC